MLSPLLEVFLLSAHWWFLMITEFSSIYCKWKIAQLTGIWVSQGKLRQIKEYLCLTSVSCCWKLLRLWSFRTSSHWTHSCFCSLLPLQKCVWAGVCVHLPPALLPQPPGIHRAKPAPSPTKSLCWAEKRKVVPGWLQPCHVPLPLISGERIKCHLLGVGTGCVRPERQQWKRGGREAGNRQRNWTTFLRASKHVVCLGSRQSLFGGCIVSCGNWLRPKPSPGSSSCTFCSQLLRMDPN